MISMAMWTLVISLYAKDGSESEQRFTGPGDFINCYNEYKYRQSKIDKSKYNKISGMCCIDAKCKSPK
jgi:hypothetical protein